MITRSKKKLLDNDNKGGNGDNNNDEIDEYGNLKDLIDYDCNEDFDRDDVGGRNVNHC